jgi:hypothetical protein
LKLNAHIITVFILKIGYPSNGGRRIKNFRNCFDISKVVENVLKLLYV